MEALRGLLTSYAYNILGSVEEAKDIVQDAYLQFITLDQSRIDNKKAYLTRVVINLSINQKKRQRKLLFNYPGEWLPEPVSTESADTDLIRKEILSYSLMVLLEQLNPRQRAVFILKEAFGYEHNEISVLIGTTEENSRKLLSRAKHQLQHFRQVKARPVDTDSLKRYLESIRRGDIQRLEELLSEDIMVISDGGGKATAGLNPVYGRKSASALLNGLYNKFYKNDNAQYITINHQPAIFYYKAGVLTTCQICCFENGLLSRVFMIRNPDKLKFLR